MFTRVNLLAFLLSQGLFLILSPYISEASDNHASTQICLYNSMHPDCFIEVSQGLLKYPKEYQLKCYLQKMKKAKKCKMHLSNEKIIIESNIFPKRDDEIEGEVKNIVIDSSEINLVRYLEYHKSFSLGQTVFGHDLNVAKKKYAKLVIKYSSNQGVQKKVVVYSRRDEINTLRDDIVKQQQLSESCCIADTSKSLPSLNLPPLSKKKPRPKLNLPEVNPFPPFTSNTKTTVKNTYNFRSFCNCQSSKTINSKILCHSEISEAL